MLGGARPGPGPPAPRTGLAPRQAGVPYQPGVSGQAGRTPKGETVRVLVIEDHAEMAETVAVGLRRVQMAVDIALDGPAGLGRALTHGYDVIVLDRDLPGMHGDQVCAELVAAGCRSRVLMLTAAAANEDLAAGLGLGADDYLPKPFDFPVLIARIGALARRAHPAVPPVLRHADLVVDTARRRAWRAGSPLELSPKEFGILELLAAGPPPACPAPANGPVTATVTPAAATTAAAPPASTRRRRRSRPGSGPAGTLSPADARVSACRLASRSRETVSLMTYQSPRAADAGRPGSRT